ncbi:MAG: CPCC family cysteine-rich protein [Streptomyces sp.]
MVSGETPTSPANDLTACPCCFQRALEERANFEICPECGWEDDGQDDVDAHIVRGGPNGLLSLAQARLDYRDVVAEGCEESMTSGGEGLWLSEARRQDPDVG